jgi:hypothetical protein
LVVAQGHFRQTIEPFVLAHYLGSLDLMEGYIVKRCDVGSSGDLKTISSSLALRTMLCFKGLCMLGSHHNSLYIEIGCYLMYGGDVY